MQGHAVDERDSGWESADARYRVFTYGERAGVVDITDASLHDALEAGRALSDDDRSLWSLALVVDGLDPRGRGLVWLSGMDYDDPPRSAADWRRRAEMQNRYLMARSRRGEPIVLPNGLRVVRLFPEWGTTLPLWESFTDNYPMDASSAGISEALAAELVAWNARWQERDEEDPVPTGWVDRGWKLHRMLQTELDGVAEVRPEFGS